MNKYTVALCYFSQTERGTLNIIREKTHGFGSRYEYMIDLLLTTDGLGQNIFRLARGHDLVILVTDFAKRHTVCEFKGHWNHAALDPYATCCMAICSSVGNKSVQPTIALESERYMNNYHLDELPADLFGFMELHRGRFERRGLTTTEWEIIHHTASDGDKEELRTLFPWLTK